MTRRRRTQGQRAEDRATHHLRELGYRIVDRNVRCGVGELDIIARDGATLVFVEVRSRQSARFGTALEAVSPAKRRQVARVAAAYLASHGGDTLCRFDVIGVTGDELIHIRDAFRVA